MSFAKSNFCQQKTFKYFSQFINQKKKKRKEMKHICNFSAICARELNLQSANCQLLARATESSFKLTFNVSHVVILSHIFFSKRNSHPR